MPRSLDTPLLVESERDAAAIAGALHARLQAAGFVAPAGDELLAALVRIAARDGEILAACINAAPDLHLAAFSDFLAPAPRPAAPARVCLSFKAAAGKGVVQVPRHTPVAADVPGDAGPVVFETDEDLELVRGEASQAWWVDAGHGSLLDAGAMLAPTAGDAAPAPVLRPVTRALHIAQPDLFGLPGLREIRLRLDIDAAGARDGGLECAWGVQTPEGWLPLEVGLDGTEGLTRSGEVRLAAPAAWPQSSAGGEPSRWLTLRAAGGSSTARLRSLQLKAGATLAARPLEAACHGILPLDVSKDFHPFGERPRFGDASLWLSGVFALPGARVELHVQLNNPQGAARPPIAAVDGAGKPVVSWEILCAGGYRGLVVVDGTRSLLDDGVVSFTVPDDVAPATLAGKTGVWLRARLVSGDYGVVAPRSQEERATPRAPSIRSLLVQATLERGPVEALRLVREEAMTRSPIAPSADRPCALFNGADVDGPALYLAFEAVFAAAGSVSLHVEAAPADGPAQPAPTGPAVAPVWQARGRGGWRELRCRDGSAGCSRSGIVRLTLDEAPTRWPGCTLDPEQRFDWLRVVWPAAGGPSPLPARRPRRIHLNGVAATHAEQIRDEVLGSASGRPAQTLRALRTPIVGDVQLQVREGDAVELTWQEVEDLAQSQACDRHFTLDRHSGLLRFGDGRRGRIPAAGSNNVRLARYAAGGGARGNVAPLTVTQLRSAIPAVSAVTNHESAFGGLDAETPAEVRAHASSWLRHRDRAVCADDYAELACRASPEVARAHCHPGLDLAAAYAGDRDAARPGVVSVVVIPHSKDPAPQPGPALLGVVADHLGSRRLPAGRLVLLGPRYALASVSAEIIVGPDASALAVTERCVQALAQFLHPVEGGGDGRGWVTGERPHRSALVSVLARIDGVDVVRSLHLHVDERAGLPHVVAAGSIVVRVCP